MVMSSMTLGHHYSLGQTSGNRGITLPQADFKMTHIGYTEILKIFILALQVQMIPLFRDYEGWGVHL